MNPRSITEPTADGAVVIDEGNGIVYARLPDWPTADGGSTTGAQVWFDIGDEHVIRQWIADGKPDRSASMRERREDIRGAFPFSWEGFQHRFRSGAVRSADVEMALAVRDAVDQIRALI